MHKVRALHRLLAVAGLAVTGFLALSSVAAADATQIVETWTNEPTGLFYNGEFCNGGTVAGYGTESGMARITELANGGVHVRGHAAGTIPLYEASGPPWDVEFGAFVGTLSYRAIFDEQVAPAAGHVSLGGVTIGQVVYADGSSQKFQVVFRLLLPEDGPAKLFLVRIICGPVA
jgi:hypothetical protein